jgi:hypothetical protein
MNIAKEECDPMTTQVHPYTKFVASATNATTARNVEGNHA